MPRSPLAPTQYYEMLLSYLVPMFAGSELEPSPIPCDIDAAMVVTEADGILLVRTDSVWPYCFRLRRTHPFDESDVRIARQFVRALGEKLVASEQPFFEYLIDKCPQDVVAWSMQHRTMDDALLPTIITTLQKWASQTYEGGRISVSIGVDCAPEPSRISSVHLHDVVSRDYAKVLSNGMDTILVVSPSGHVVEHVALRAKSSTYEHTSDASFAPNRYLPLAEWAKATRVALALNRQGEILLFKGQQLQFAFRRGTWSHFSHQALIARMGGSTEQRRLMRAVYVSCLDISFARTGGCIAVANGRNANKVSDYLNSGDLLASRKTDKATLLKHLIGQPFQEIPRPIREEMAALDGAVVLDRKGIVMAAGAIVRVPGGSEGGGRRAAAKALSRLGLAVKVSSDGAITAFTDRGTRENPEIAFDVCV
jgi:hypothetical protein